MAEQNRGAAGEQPAAEEPFSPEEALRRRAAETESVVEFIDRTTFAADEENATGELTTADQHPADTSDITYERELNLTVREIAEARMAQIEEALERQRAGTYGICVNCGAQIDPERLRARPEATLCIDCQRQKERSTHA